MQKRKLHYSLLCISTILCLVIYACRKESHNTAIDELNDPNSALNIASAEEYYTQLVQTNGDTVGHGSVAVQSINSTAQVNKKYVMFNKASTGVTDSYSFVEAALRYNRRSSATVVANNTPGDRMQQIQLLNSSFDRLFIFKNKKTGKMDQHIITYMPDADYLKRHNNDISNNTLNKLDTDFNGYIKFKTWNGKELSLLRIQNGKGVKRMYPGRVTKPISGSSKTINSVKPLTEVCRDLYLYTYSQECWYSGPENSIEECGDWIIIDQEYVETDCFDDGNSDDSCDNPMNMNTDCDPNPEGCPVTQSIKNGKITYTETNCSQAANIANNISDSCLHAMVNSTLSANVNTKINKLIQDVFGVSKTVNTTFIDVTTLPFNVDGYTPPVAADINGNINVEIQLNKNTMPNYSQEYIARVIMHEALHAFMDANGISSALQHDVMLSYVTKMAESLQEIFPGLTDDTAKNLALGGLQVSPYFETVKNELNLSSGFDALQLAYSIGSLGTRCH